MALASFPRPPGDEKFDGSLLLAVSTRYTSVTARQTDRQTDTARQQRPRYGYLGIGMVSVTDPGLL